LDSWLNPPQEEQELSIVVYDPALSGMTWGSSPEAEMVETGFMKKVILRRIVDEIKNQIRWRRTWDSFTQDELKSRGEQGQC
jgi:hypothetical protein